MSDRPEVEILQFQGQAIPQEPAADLFGHDADPPPDDAIALAASLDGEWIAGALLLLEGAADDGRVGSIRQLVVRPAARGKGLGGRLIRRAETAAREAGCGRIRTTAGFGCPDHMALYSRLRYERVSGQAPYLMGKSL